MALPPKATRVSREDLPGSPDWVDRLLQAQSTHQEQTSAALDRSLTVADNMQTQSVSVDVIGPDHVWTPVAPAGNPAPSFLNGWVNYDGSHEPASFRIDHAGRVYRRGLIKSGTIGLDAFILPVGYRPAFNVTFPSDSNGAHGSGRVWAATSTTQTPGGVSPLGGSNAFFSLEGSFQAAAPCAAPIRPTGQGWPVSIKLTVPTVSWVQVVKVQDLDAASNTTFQAEAVPEWSMSTSGQLLLLAVPGLTPGRKYRLTIQVWAA